MRYVHHNVLQLSETILLSDACTFLMKAKTDDIIVIDNHGTVVGIVTDEDILKCIAESHVNSSKTTLGDVMVFPVISIMENQNIQDALTLMRDNQIRKLVVLDNSNHVTGILYMNTIANLMRKSIIKNPKELTLLGVLWNLGLVLQFSGVLMFIPGLIATLLNDVIVASGIYLMSILLIISGFILNAYGEKQSLTLRGTAILVFSSFIILVLFGMIPQLYVIPINSGDPVILFSDGFFESASGFTTGGLTIVSNPEDLPRSFTFYRGYTQFVGGLSFIYLIIIVFYSESKLNIMKGFLSGKTQNLRELFVTITIIFSIYVVIIALLLFFLGEDNILDNFAIAFSGISTGGWVPDSKSLENFTSAEYIVLMSSMILGSLPFTFHYSLIRRKFLTLKLTKEIITYFIILIIFSVLFIFSMDSNPMDSLFILVSGNSTTGFQTIKLDNIGTFSAVILIISMMIGGCGFSTTGGMKVFRLMKMVHLKKFFNGNFWSVVSHSDKLDILAGFIILGTSVVVPLLVASYMSSLGMDFENSFFDAVSAITTTGLGTGTVTDSLDPFLKVMFGFLTILGRVEIVLLVYIFVPKIMK